MTALRKDPDIEGAALAAGVGISPIQYLAESDPFEIIVREAVIDQRLQFDERWRQDQAIRIANAVGKVLGG